MILPAGALCLNSVTWVFSEIDVLSILFYLNTIMFYYYSLSVENSIEHDFKTASKIFLHFINHRADHLCGRDAFCPHYCRIFIPNSTYQRDRRFLEQRSPDHRSSGIVCGYSSGERGYSRPAEDDRTIRARKFGIIFCHT